MPLFLTRDQIYRLLQRELPEGVYPDGPPSAYFSTAENDAVADCAATAYGNLERIYENYWPQTADERIADWEITAFGRRLDASLTLAERRDRILTKLRSRKGLTIGDMIEVVKGIIGSDKLVDIAEWGCATGGWLIGESQLGIETVLSGFPSRLLVTGPMICEADPADYGLTPEEWAIMQEDAYTYTVNVYGYTLSAAELVEVDLALSEAEPARSQHKILSGLNPENMLAGPYEGEIFMALESGDGDVLQEDADFLLIG